MFRVQVHAHNIVAYLGSGKFSRGEQEFLVLLPPRTRLVVHTRDRADIEAGRARWTIKEA